jgi:hypothetical protein
MFLYIVDKHGQKSRVLDAVCMVCDKEIDITDGKNFRIKTLDDDFVFFHLD